MTTTNWMGVDVIIPTHGAVGVRVPDDDYARFGDQLIECGARFVEAGKEWRRRLERDGVCVRIARLGGAFDWFHTHGQVAAPAESLFDLLCDTDRIASYDATDRGGEMLREFTPERWIYYAKNSLPMLKPRDGVIFEERRVLDDGAMIFVAKSVVLDDCPDRAGFVRYDQQIWVAHVRPDGADRSTLTLINCRDPSGRFSPWIVNRATPGELIKMYPKLAAIAARA